MRRIPSPCVFNTRIGIWLPWRFDHHTRVYRCYRLRSSKRNHFSLSGKAVGHRRAGFTSLSPDLGLPLIYDRVNVVNLGSLYVQSGHNISGVALGQSQTKPLASRVYYCDRHLTIRVIATSRRALFLFCFILFTVRL